jgi:hypothetical protein
MKTLRKKWLLLGGVFGAGVGAVVVSALAIFAGAGIAAGQAKPVNSSPPTITGTPQEGKTLTGNRGTWDNTPTDYNYFWRRCNAGGNNCDGIGGANALTYTLRAGDVGRTIRFRVVAKNADGQSDADSAPTDVVQKASTPTPTPPPSNGCSNQVSQMSLPAKLIIDQFQSDPSTLNRGTQSFALRVHVTSTCGGPVQGALVYGTPTPFNQFDETQSNTGSDGWATLNFSRQPNYPVNGKQQILAMFLRASKPGENVLAGITGYRLVSVNVNL